MTKRRPLALGAAAAIGFGSLFFAAPTAFAEDEVDQPVIDQTEEQAPAEDEAAADPKDSESEDQDAKSEDEDPQLEAAEAIEQADLPIIAFGENANGETLVYTAEQVSKTEEQAMQTFALDAGAIDKGETIKVIADRVSEPGTPYAANDVVGGAGYLSLEGDTLASACSMGFTAWTPSGDPAILTAAHCTADGTFDNTVRSIPSEQPAHLGEGAGDEQWAPLEQTLLGAFGFSQFGGPGNADGQDDSRWPDDPESPDSAESYDLAVIENIDDSFNLLPEVTDWSTAGSDDLSGSTTEITSVGAPTIGDVSKSGRTTGKTDGTITDEDITRGYHRLWASNEPGETRWRWVKGFASSVQSAGGDSGGAVYQGGKAVGVVSGGAGNDDRGELTWASLLDEVPAELEGYEVALHIDAPEVTSDENGAELEPGEEISGTAPSNATDISYSFQPNSGAGGPVEDGAWSLNAPEEPGEYTLTITATNGHSHSESTTFDFTVAEAAVAAPAITSPADGSSVEGPVETIEGTGIAGATLTMTGDVESEVEVDENGNWSVPTELTEGEYSITVQQSVDGEDSRTVSATFTVTGDDEEPPVEDVEIGISSIENGAEYTLANAPTAVSGTATAGATVTGSLDAENGEFEAVADADGNWTAELGYEPALGGYTLEATASLDGETSDTVSVDFTIVDGNGGGGDEGGNGGEGDNGDELPDTGFDAMSMAPYIAGAALMALLGAAAILMTARRQRGLSDES
ncbi:LPXTG cell wall anchor domain-containing protein [Leucobacter sp. GX24907]